MIQDLVSNGYNKYDQGLNMPDNIVYFLANNPYQTKDLVNGEKQAAIAMDTINNKTSHSVFPMPASLYPHNRDFA